MTRPEALLHHGANLLVAGTGLVYGWMLYLVTPTDDFAVVNHPLQPDFQAWHILLAPLLIFAIGYSWQMHVWARIRYDFPHKRKTGLILFALVLPMIVSGYALQVSVEETAREIWLWMHLVASGGWILAYIVHLALPNPQMDLPADF
ncbi:MAG: hypothetical protein ACI8TQ_002541 [Planctomycetota bacterium]